MQERKLVWDKIGVPLMNPNRNTRPGWEIRLEESLKKMRQQARVLWKNTEEYVGRKKQNETEYKSDNATCRDEFKDIGKRMNT